METQVLDYNFFFKKNNKVKSIRMIHSFWLERDQIQLDLMRMTLGFT